MRMKRWIGAGTVALGLILTPTTAMANHGFGDAPLDTVLQEAGNITKCSGLTKNKLAAIMLAPTWGESGAGEHTPSPMSMGREDYNDVDIYSEGTLAGQPRAFWHPGVGVWQLDDAGDGANLAAHQRIAVATAANKVASVMKSSWCSSSGTEAARRSAAWNHWYACNNGSCESIFQHIYCSSTDTVCNIDRNPAVGGWGGMVTHQCRYGADDGTSFTCWYVDILNAQGWTDIWKRDPKVGSGSLTAAPSPLTEIFYSYRISSGQVEVRDWLKEDTTYANHYRAKRQDGANSRSGLNWGTQGVDPLCDKDNRHGTCG